MPELILAKESYAIMGACFQVYKDKGHGFLEPVYQECMKIEFDHLCLVSPHADRWEDIESWRIESLLPLPRAA